MTLPLKISPFGIKMATAKCPRHTSVGQQFFFRCPLAKRPHFQCPSANFAFFIIMLQYLFRESIKPHLVNVVDFLAMDLASSPSRLRNTCIFSCQFG